MKRFLNSVSVVRLGLPLLLAVFLLTSSMVRAADPLRLSRADYANRAHAAWVAQMAAVYLGFPFDNQAASVKWLKDYPRPYTHSIVDDDWYYEMSALRAFEKHGTGMTVQQLGEQWLADRCGSWGSSREARLNMERGVRPPDCGHPRYNRSWWTIAPQFSAEIHGLLAPDRPNLAARLAREFGHINGYAQAVDGATFVAGMVSQAFVENDPRTIVRQAAALIHAESPYRKCLDEIIVLADAGKSFEDIEHIVIERWTAAYPGTNNAVANGGIVALCVWFGEGDFLTTVNLACRVTDYTDADCNAAGAAAVVGVMHGLRAIPKQLLDPLHDRVIGDTLGDVPLPPVDESISALGRRTAAIEMMPAHGLWVTMRVFAPFQPASGATPKTYSRLASCLRRRWETSWRTTWRFSPRRGGTIGAKPAALRTSFSAGTSCSRRAAVPPARSRCSRRRPRNGPPPEAENPRETGLSQFLRFRMPPMPRSGKRRSPTAPRCASCLAKNPVHSCYRSPMPRP